MHVGLRVRKESTLHFL